MGSLKGSDYVIDVNDTTISKNIEHEVNNNNNNLENYILRVYIFGIIRTSLV